MHSEYTSVQISLFYFNKRADETYMTFLNSLWEITLKANIWSQDSRVIWEKVMQLKKLTFIMRSVRINIKNAFT
jgi:hypothetical protein